MQSDGKMRMELTLVESTEDGRLKACEAGERGTRGPQGCLTAMPKMKRQAGRYQPVGQEGSSKAANDDADSRVHGRVRRV